MKDPYSQAVNLEDVVSKVLVVARSKQYDDFIEHVIELDAAQEIPVPSKHIVVEYLCVQILSSLRQIKNLSSKSIESVEEYRQNERTIKLEHKWLNGLLRDLYKLVPQAFAAKTSHPNLYSPVGVASKAKSAFQRLIPNNRRQPMMHNHFGL
jgi:hypothetical protein